jgi:hypothetical protein
LKLERKPFAKNRKRGSMDDKPQSPAEPQDGQFGRLGARARDTGAGVKEMAKDVAWRGAALAGEVAVDVKDRMLSAAEKSKDGVGERLADAADAVHRSGEQLEGHQDWLAQLVERGADELGNLASAVRSNDLRGLVGKLENMARMQPVLFVGAAMAAGFASARLGKVAIAGASRSDFPTIKEGDNGPE